MLDYLKGTVLHIPVKGKLVMDVRDVGYGVFVPKNYSVQKGDPMELWIYTHVREDVLALYGFLSEKEKEVFTTLISISGIGPKVALNILSSVSYQDLTRWIESEDIQSLSGLPKIGKKTAGQMILSLKGKWPSVALPVDNKIEVKTRAEISFALMNLGFRSVEIKEVLDRVDMRLGVKQGIQQALSILQSL